MGGIEGACNGDDGAEWKEDKATEGQVASARVREVPGSGGSGGKDIEQVDRGFGIKGVQRWKGSRNCC